jgi:hypothetical protein
VPPLCEALVRIGRLVFAWQSWIATEMGRSGRLGGGGTCRPIRPTPSGEAGWRLERIHADP